MNKSGFLFFSFASICISFFFVFSTFAEEATQSENIELEQIDTFVLPNESTDWNDRFIFTELQKIRTKMDTMKQELYADIQNRELETIDRALSYSANTLNYFFVFLSIIIMGLGIMGWKALTSVKDMVKRNMEKEMDKLLLSFQEKMEKIEQDQQLNILWRSFSFSDQSNDKLDILDSIKQINPESRQMMIEKTNLFLEMELYNQCIEACNELLELESGNALVIFNKAVSSMHLEETETALENIEHLLKISPDYRENIEEDEIFKPLWNKI